MHSRGVLWRPLYFAGVQAEGQIGRTETENAGEERHETGEAPPVVEIVTDTEEANAEEDAENAVNAANI